ncbi:hypothetical protein COY17_01055 [Candidatus Saccharibacteria bacterium CG_4_10_14_0_2_um_filter_52_9]|nr:MAG: hypothetical protein COY17_01055 [Candidatus Saccharibacteria bacterium CG_4_10_14_0_2_um_filter_52_9]
MSEQLPIAVVKYGSSSVANGIGMDTKRLHHFAYDLAELKHTYGLVVVTSGAVAVGRVILGAQGVDASEQTLATVGSGKNFTGWQLALAQHNIHSGQLLVTHHEIKDRQEGGMLRRVMLDNAAAGVVSVVNENDALSDLEIAKLKYGGDNDGLAGHIAELLEAEQLCLMTDVEGLLDESGRVVREVNDANADWARDLSDQPGNMGRGGMRTKVAVGLKVSALGIEAHIGAADLGPQSLMQKQSGTHFPAH